MPRANHQPMLTQFLIDERKRFPSASGDFNGLILDVATACKTIAKAVAWGNLTDLHGAHEDASVNVHGETQKKLDVFANATFLRFNEASGTLAGMVSEEIETPYQIPEGCPRGKYLLLFDPLDGSSNIDVNAPVGTVFSILRAPDSTRPVTDADFLQKGSQQVAAGYALYGPATMLVLTVGRGVHGFTLDPSLGDFVLTHPDLRIPEDTQEFSINTANSRFWEPPVKRYVDDCLKGTTGPRGKDFNMRWIAAMVADAHRLLLRGGVFLYPRDTKTPGSAGRLRLLYEANPLGFLVEQAGGRASTGAEPILGVQPTSIHQRIGLVFGSRNEVERIERYHADPNASLSGEPLFAVRGLFRD
jgi:fructose-1,6-bisphosphatase I/sedoheptulose-1,7-bisphosphatase